MKLLVTGATGFVGQHIVPKLLGHNHEVTVTSRSEEKVSGFDWQKEVRLTVYDIHQPDPAIPQSFTDCDAIIHLAWGDVPNYTSLSHFEENLPADYRFLKALVEAGMHHVLVSGTCYEYGMQTGCLSEDMPAYPCNPYALAKDALRRFLQSLQMVNPFTLQWVRLFYMYGSGQNPRTVLAQLDRAIDGDEPVFNMSGGEQLLDYLSVEEVADRLVTLVEHPEIQGIINCCSGKPISVRRLVERRIAERQANIKLNLGHYPYRDYEPMAFWGNSKKLDQLLQS